MANNKEPWYYEIALTPKQAVSFTAILLASILGALLLGVWLGRGSDDAGKMVFRQFSMVIIGAGAALLVAYLVNTIRTANPKAFSFEDRVDQLTLALRDSANLISEIEGEIQARSELVSKLRNDVERYKNLATLTRPEIEAVTQALRGEISRGSRLSFMQSALLNFFFFILGLAVSFLVRGGS